jgi:hypothetical protein
MIPRNRHGVCNNEASAQRCAIRPCANETLTVVLLHMSGSSPHGGFHQVQPAMLARMLRADIEAAALAAGQSLVSVEAHHLEFVQGLHAWLDPQARYLTVVANRSLAATASLVVKTVPVLPDLHLYVQQAVSGAAVVAGFPIRGLQSRIASELSGLQVEASLVDGSMTRLSPHTPSINLQEISNPIAPLGTGPQAADYGMFKATVNGVGAAAHPLVTSTDDDGVIYGPPHGRGRSPNGSSTARFWGAQQGVSRALASLRWTAPIQGLQSYNGP